MKEGQKFTTREKCDLLIWFSLKSTLRHLNMGIENDKFRSVCLKVWSQSKFHSEIDFNRFSIDSFSVIKIFGENIKQVAQSHCDNFGQKGAEIFL